MTKKQENLIVYVLGALAAIGPFSIDMYLPAFGAIAGDLRLTIAEVGYSLTSYFVGISAGQLLYGPVTDRFGRKRPLTAGLFLYLAACIGCTFAFSAQTLIVFRFFMALGACSGMVVGRAIVRDLFPPRETARIFSALLLVMGVAPVIAPSVGGALSTAFGWRAVFVFLTVFAALLILAVSRFLRESRPADPSVSLRPASVLAGYTAVVKERRFIAYAFAGGFSGAGMFAYISGAPFVFMELFGFSKTRFGWIFGLNAFGFVSGSQLNRCVLRYKPAARIAAFGAAMQTLSGSILLAGTLFGFLPRIGFIILVFNHLFWHGFVNPNSLSLALEPFDKNAGSASALIGALQMFLAALASAFVSTFADGTALPLAAGMAGCAILGLVFQTGRIMKPEAALR
jgi:DHA1 family bicyclomycin/chloramphenicol resistance-like MFS transporter